MATSATLKPAPSAAPAEAAPVDADQAPLSRNDLPRDVQIEIENSEFADKLSDQRISVDIAAIAAPLSKEAFNQPEHSSVYLAARSVVHGVAEKCDTTVGNVLQWAPPVKAVCATAETLDHLDNAYDSHLQGDDKNVKASLIQAGRKAVPGLDTVATVIETAKVAFPSEPKTAPKIAANVEVAAAAPEAVQMATPEVAKPSLEHEPARPAAPRGPSSGFLSMLSSKETSRPSNSASPFKMR